MENKRFESLFGENISNWVRDYPTEQLTASRAAKWGLTMSTLQEQDDDGRLNFTDPAEIKPIPLENPGAGADDG